MKRLVNLLLVLFLCNVLSAQHKFVDGYFIDNSGQKIACLIFDKDWKDTPTEFAYKTSTSGDRLVAGIDEVSEFGVEGVFKYKAFKVKIDKSLEQINLLSSDSKPAFIEEKVFLKSVVEGKTSLYVYREFDVMKFFYRKDDISIPEQLLYKKYKKGNVIKVNETFKTQLWEDLKCENTKMEVVTNLEYKEKEIAEYFINYNECIGAESKSFLIKRKWSFSIAARAGVKLSNSRLRGAAYLSTDFDNELGYNFGLELDMNTPFKNRKWSIIFNPTIHFSKGKSTTILDFPTELKYNSIEMPLGIRYYLYLRNNSRLFINGFTIYDIPFNSEIQIDGNVIRNIDITNSISFAFGIGGEWNNKVLVELRGQPNRNIINLTAYDFYHRYLSLNIGYRF